MSVSGHFFRPGPTPLSSGPRSPLALGWMNGFASGAGNRGLTATGPPCRKAICGEDLTGVGLGPVYVIRQRLRQIGSEVGFMISGYCRKRAEEARVEARVRHNDRDSWLKIAEKYDRLADEMARREAAAAVKGIEKLAAA